MMTVFCLPILFVLADINPLLLAAALTIIDAGHLPVLMWIHLDYTYFLAACAKLVIGLAFLLSFPDIAPVGVGILLEGINFVFVVFDIGITTFVFFARSQPGSSE